MGGMGRWFVIDGLAEMVCDGDMISMVYHGSMGLVVCHKVHWYSGLLFVVCLKWFVTYSMDETARHGWNELKGLSWMA